MTTTTYYLPPSPRFRSGEKKKKKTLCTCKETGSMVHEAKSSLQTFITLYIVYFE